MKHTSGWQKLFREAVSLIDQSNVVDHWTFGGGTAMMLQVGHRESNDVDIFIDDPQLLPYLNPESGGFHFDIPPSHYNGDGTRFQKIAFEGIGEIDFIVGASMTADPWSERMVEGRLTKVERVPEIIAKKIHYRGATITPRDIFDIAVAAQDHKGELMKALETMPKQVAATLSAMEKLKPEFVKSTISALQIMQAFEGVKATAVDTTTALLRQVSA